MNSAEKVNRLRQFSQSATMILVCRLAGLAFSLLVAPVLARVLGPEDRGETAAAISILLMLPIVLAYGTPIAVRRAFAKSNDDGERTLRTARLFSFFPAALTAAIAFPVSLILLPGLSTDAKTAFLIAAPLCVLTGGLWICNTSMMIGRGKTLQYALISVLPTISYSLIVIALWLAGVLTVASVIWAQLFSYALTFVASQRAVRVRISGPRIGFRNLLRGSRSFAGGQIAETASFRLDQALVLPLIGAHGSGLYAVSVTIALLPYMLGQSVASTIFRQASHEAVGIGSEHRAAALIRVSFALGLISALFLAVLVPWLIPIAFGEDYVGAIVPTWIGLGGAIALTVTQGCGTLLVVRNHGWGMTLAQVVGLAIATGLLIALSPSFGVIGASAASAVGYALTTFVMLHRLKIPARYLWPRPTDAKSLGTLFTRGRF